MSARQAPLFASPSTRARQPLLAPHATAEDMARKRDVFMMLVKPPATPAGSVLRCNTRPLDAVEAFLPRIGRNAEALQAVQGRNAEDIEIRLTPQAAGAGPLHLLAILDGLTLDEARKALTTLRERGQ